MNPATLRSRLREVIQAPGARPPAVVHDPAFEPMSPRLQSTAGSAEEVLGGSWRETSTGRSFVVSRRYEPDVVYGRQCVGDIHVALERASAASRLFGAPMAQPPFVFFDLETTGLNGGAGTHAFLVGCGRFVADGAFVVDQHVMTGYGAERAMLRVVADDLERAGALVTFNGKSFDAPLMETRFLFHRSESPCSRLPHLDVLHPARRFWGGARESGCSLTTLESQILGARRTGDVPGFEIPARYFQFVRSGDAGPLAPVLEHNRLDLVSLAGLTARLLSLADEGPEASHDAHELLALGRVYERAGLPWRAEQAFERVLTMSETSALQSLRVEALRALAIAARKARRHDIAAARWQQVIEVPGCPAQVAGEAAEALAIHHEHRVRDLEVARMFALKSLNGKRGVARDDAVRHRLARIERKMVSERSPLFPSSPSQPAYAVRPSAHRTSS